MAILVGTLALTGWALDSALLKSVFPGLPPMVPVTATAFVLAGVSLWLLRSEAAGIAARRIAQSGGLLVALIGAVTVSEYLFDWNSGLDQLLFKEKLRLDQSPIPGRPAMLTAVNFVLLGSALLFLDAKPGGSRLVEGLIVTAIAISLLAFIGHAYNVPSFYGWLSLYPNRGMAMHTVVAFVVLGAGALLARPDHGLMRVLTSATDGGMVARRLLLAPVIIPFLTSYLRLTGQRLGIYNNEFGSWLFSFLNIFVFTVAIWWIASLLYRSELVRRRAEGALHRLNAGLENRVEERTAELQRAQKTLREKEERLRLIIDTALDAVVTINERGVVTGWSRQAEKIFGWKADEILGQRLSETIVPARFREAHARGLKRFLESREGPVLNQRIELPALRCDGREIPVELTITPVQIGSEFMFSAFVRDITERKRAEAEIRQLTEKLEQRVTERTAQLELVNKELEAFSYSVSHDLRAPLRHIDGFLNLLAKEADAALNDNCKRYLQTISHSAKQMGALIDDLLAFSRMGRTELRQRPFSMDELVTEVFEELSRETQGRNIAFERDRLPEVFADRALLKQVWVNLLSNAVKYTCHRERAEVKIGWVERDSELEFYVEDNGAGFDMRYAHKLFGVFQRLHPPEEFEGTGIGLANVRRIVGRHGGRTWANGEVDKGATIHFTLPKNEAGIVHERLPNDLSVKITSTM